MYFQSQIYLKELLEKYVSSRSNFTVFCGCLTKPIYNKIYAYNKITKVFFLLCKIDKKPFDDIRQLQQDLKLFQSFLFTLSATTKVLHSIYIISRRKTFLGGKFQFIIGLYFLMILLVFLMQDNFLTLYFRGTIFSSVCKVFIIPKFLMYSSLLF